MLAAAIASKSGRTELSGGFEPDAREGRRVPGLAAAAGAVAEDRHGPTGAPARPGGRRPFAAARRAMLTTAQ